MYKKYFIIVLIIVLIGTIIFWLRDYLIQPKSEVEKVYKIGLLQMAPTVSENIEGFKQGMSELGYKEGVNVNYIYRDAKGDLELLKSYAQELVDMKPDLIFVNTSPATDILKQKTQDIPIVYSMVADPVKAGFVKTMKSSGNNLTGTSCAYIDMAPKRLQVLKEIDPLVKKVLIFYRPSDKSGGPAVEKILEKAPEIGLKIITVPINEKEEIHRYLNKLKKEDVDAIMDPADAMVTAGLMEWGVEKALELKIPLLMLSKREAEKGALASFGVDYVDLGKQSSLIANQVLNGIPPSHIPSEYPRKFYFSINLITANKIGLKIPNEVLQKADLIIK